jgi:hypothetical protein
MPESTNLLMLEFLTWVADRPRTYDEAMEAWQSHCPRQTIWEDAMIDGLIQIGGDDDIRNSDIILTQRGKALLNGNSGRH